MIRIMVIFVTLAASTAMASEALAPKPEKVDCKAVREFVAAVGKDQAEQYARASGAKEADVRQALQCLQPSQHRG